MNAEAPAAKDSTAPPGKGKQKESANQATASTDGASGFAWVIEEAFAVLFPTAFGLPIQGRRRTLSRIVHCLARIRQRPALSSRRGGDRGTRPGRRQYCA